jgi:Mycotoxin biosynthesis protein UstYa
MSYKPLLNDSASDSSGDDVPHFSEKFFAHGKSHHRRLYPRLAALIFAFSIFLNILLTFGVISFYQQKEAQSPNLFWTPFNARLKHHVRRFTSGFGSEVSKYQGPSSPQKDADWADLYVEAFVIPKEDAKLLANKTGPATSEPDSGYLTSFSVFHYLHCLDMVRKVTEHIYYPEHYNLSAQHNPWTSGLSSIEGFQEDGPMADEHIGHCIDSIRQALMCQPDLGPVVWQWVPSDQRVKVWAQTVHTCANWDELLDFAKEREYTDDFVRDQRWSWRDSADTLMRAAGFKQSRMIGSRILAVTVALPAFSI